MRHWGFSNTAFCYVVTFKSIQVLRASGYFLVLDDVDYQNNWMNQSLHSLFTWSPQLHVLIHHLAWVLFIQSCMILLISCFDVPCFFSCLVCYVHCLLGLRATWEETTVIYWTTHLAAQSSMLLWVKEEQTQMWKETREEFQTQHGG